MYTTCLLNVCVRMQKLRLHSARPHMCATYTHAQAQTYVMWRNVSLNNDVIVVNACATNGCHRRDSSSSLTNEPKRLTFVSWRMHICTLCMCMYVSVCFSLSISVSLADCVCKFIAQQSFSFYSARNAILI